MAEAAEVVPQAARQSESTPSAYPELDALLAEGVAEGLFPGASCQLVREGQPIWAQQLGTLGGESGGAHRVLPHTVYDIDRVTASLVTTSLMMHFVSQGRLRLQDRISRHVHGFGVHGKSPVTLADVLAHAAGVPATMNFREDLERTKGRLTLGVGGRLGSAQHVFNRINRSKPRSKPGHVGVKSDVSFLLLGHLIEIMAGMPIDKAAQQYLFRPLGLSSTGFIDLQQLHRGHVQIASGTVAPTVVCSWRKRELHGEVYDETTWAMGGASGLSGVFSNVRDLSLLSQLLIDCYHGRSDFIRPAVMKSFFGFGGSELAELERQSPGVRLGWDLPTELTGGARDGLRPGEVIASGSTGCVVWLLPESGHSLVVLTNFADPGRNHRRVASFWPKFLGHVRGIL